MIHVEQAWAYAPTLGAGVRVCSVDTGVSLTNPDISPAIIGGVNTSTILAPNDYADDGGHGTFTSGQIVARGKQITGVAPRASLLVAKVLDATGNGDDVTVTAGIAFCIANHAQVINMSLAGYSNKYLGLYQMVKFGCDHGADFVMASGNEHADGGVRKHNTAIDSPCVISANAIDNHGYLARFSNYNEIKRTVGAPGKAIIGYWGNNLAYASGTSMSAPLVAGTLALLRGMGANATEAVEVLLATAAPPAHNEGPAINRLWFGYGILDSGAAVRAFATRMLIRRNIQ